MAATNDAKQKKGSLMSLYKAATASPRHHLQPPEPSPDHRHRNQADIKSYISRGWLFRRSKLTRSATTREPDHTLEEAVAGGRGEDDVRKAAEPVLVEGRRSVSHVESNLGSVVSFLQVKVLACDMPSYMQVHAFRSARRTHDSLEKFSARHMAYNIKKEFDKVHGPAWHCIVGSSFGSFVTHSTGCFLYFSMDKLYILLFKTKIQKAPHS